MDETKINQLLDAMTLEEQVALLAGASFWETVPVERLGIPAIKVSDGPNGARGGGSLVGGVSAACFPAGISLGSSWNTALIEQVGKALGEEAKTKGATVLLAPTVNLHRSTLNGRNFEAYSEDPYLTAEIGKAYIEGVQSTGVGATIKHYVGNESEFERMTINSEIDERALRELYLLPFEVAVKQAHVWAVMAAYNKVNGTYASENARTQIEILKDEWGFDGVVMSDWFATHSVAETLNGGLDLEMPGPTKFRGEQLVAAVRQGQVSAEAVRESARRMLRLIARTGAFERQGGIPDEQAVNRPDHQALARRAAAEGIVLLKNEGVLPLDPAKIDSIAIIGPNAKTARIMGGGSAQVNAHYRVSPYEGVAAQVGEQVELAFAPGSTNHKLLPLLGGGFVVEYFNSPDLSGPVVWQSQTSEAELMWFNEIGPGINPQRFSARISGQFVAEEDGEYHFGLVSAGKSRLLVDGKLVVENWEQWQPGDTYFGGGSVEAIGTLVCKKGQTYVLSVEYGSTGASGLGINAVRAGVILPLGEDAIEQAARLAAQSDAAVLFVGLSGEWDSEGADRPHMDLVGRQDELIARVAAANPRTVVVLQTGGPITMPWLGQVAGVLQAWYPGQECGNAISDVLFGAVNPSGHLPQSFPHRLEDNPAFLNYPGENGKVRYGEGIFIGYRYYEKKKIAPLFPFGFGLSYTSFAYTNLRLSASSILPGGQLTATVDVANTGERAGQAVVQLYVRDPQSRLARPEKELKGFAKVELAPGETRSVAITLDMRSLAYYDDARAAWVADAGAFEVLIGSSAADIHQRASFSLAEEWHEPASAKSSPVSA
ncbi:beta-glucosidase [Chloroflexia bacterium SDU3-3]|nr:beta-glucosidase [Chloroflexia bacterium SDU3-3]